MPAGLADDAVLHGSVRPGCFIDLNGWAKGDVLSQPLQNLRWMMAYGVDEPLSSIKG